MATSISGMAATITSTSSGGDWSLISTWVGGVVPTATDDVVIAVGANVLVRSPYGPGSPALCNSITIDGTLTFGSGSASVRRLDVTTFVTINSGAILTNDGTAAHLLNIGGNWTNSGTFNPLVNTGTITVTFNGTGTQTLDGVATQAFQSFIVNKASGTLQSSANFNTMSAASLSITAGTFSAPESLSVSGNILVSAGTLNLGLYLYLSGNFANSGGTVNGGACSAYLNGNSQILGGNFPLSFNITTVSGNVTTVVAVTTGLLNIFDGATLTIGGFDFTVSDSVRIGHGNSGSIIFSSTAGTKTFGGFVTVSSGATWTNSINENIYFHNGLTNSGNFTPGTGTYNFEINSQTLTGNYTLTHVAVAAGATLINNGMLTVSSSLSGVGTLQQGNNAVLTLAGSQSITGLVANTSINTVNYTGSGNPKGVNYSNLNLSGSGVKNLLAGTTTISGNLNLSGTITTSTSTALSIGGTLTVGDGTTLNVEGYDLTVTGATIIGNGISGTINFPSSVGTKVFGGLVTLSTGATWNNSTNNEEITFRGGIINSGTFMGGTSTQTFDTNNQTLNGDFSIPKVAVNGITLTVLYDLIIDVSLSGTGSISSEGLSYIELNGAASLSSFIAPGFGGLVKYSDAAPAIVLGSYGNLILNQSSGSASLTGPTVVNGLLGMLNGNLNIGTNILTLGDTASIYNPTQSVTNMIIASGGGEIRKVMTSTGSFDFPIGDITATPEYSPVIVNLTAGSGFNNAYISVAVTDAKHPSNSSPTNFLTRYWKIGQSGITGAVATVTGTYAAADIAGTEGSISAAYLDGTFNVTTNPWKKASTTGSNPLTFTGATLTNGQNSAFSGISATGPAVAITGGGGTVCANTSVSLGATVSGDPTLTYSWSPSTGLSSASVVNPTATVASTTTYTLTVYDANGVTATDNTTITTQAPTIAADNITICEGTTGVLTASGAVTYTWSPATGLSATTGTSVNATPTTTTTYTITGTDANTCQNTKQVTVNVNPKPNVTVNSPSVCASTPVNLTASGASTYTWSPGAGLSSTAGNPVIATISSTSTYTVTGTDNNNCTNTANATVTITQLPAKPTITGSDLGSISPTLTSSSATGNQWYKNGNIIVGAITQTLDVTEDGSYTVIVTTGGCTGPTSDAYVIVITGLGDEGRLMKLYPNPASDVLKIEWTGFSSDKAIQIRIVDMLGRVVMSHSVTTVDENLNIENISKGQHILLASQGNKNNRIRFSKE